MRVLQDTTNLSADSRILVINMMSIDHGATERWKTQEGRERGPGSGSLAPPTLNPLFKTLWGGPW